METQENSRLHDACRKGDLGRVRRILSRGLVNVNSRSEKHKMTPLMVAAQEGHRRLFDFLSQEGANVSDVDEYGDSVLHLTCRGGRMGIVKHVVKHYSVDINSKGMYGSTPLLQTVYCGYRVVLKFLVTKGANLSHVDDDGENVLHWACRGGHLDIVKHILTTCSVDINSRENHGQTPLMKSASEGHRHVFQFLVSKGANVSHVDDKGDNILHHASIGGHAKMIQYIISQDMVDINSRGNYGRTPLMRAAYYGHRKVFDLLVSKGCLTHLVDGQGLNILHLACWSGRMEMVKFILSLNIIDIISRTKTGRTPLMMAASRGHKDVFEFLFSIGGQPHLVDSEGNNILHLAVYHGQVEMSKHILSKNIVDINSRTHSGQTPLIRAACKGHKDVFKFLVSKGANVSHVDDKGDSILHHASIGGHAKMVQYIISQDMVDINSIGNYGRTPLMRATYYGHRKVFDLLVCKGGVTHLVDGQGLNILHLASWIGRMEMVKHILSLNIIDIISRTKTGRTPLMMAASRGHKDVFEFLLSIGGQPHLMDSEGNNILHLAACHGQVEMSKHILSKNIVDINSRTHSGQTPLIKAAYKGHKDVFKFLVSKGANVSHVDDKGDSILHHASIGGHAKMVQYIISQDMVDINSIGNYGRTPLMRATYYGHRKVFDLLVSKGCLTHLVDGHGFNILHLASWIGRMEMVKHILSLNIIDIISRTKMGRTSLMMAASRGHKDVFEFLFSIGGQPHLVDSEGNNILHLAAYHRQVEMSKHILSKNIVDINSRTHSGQTPLIRAACKGHKDVFKFLVSKGANVSHVDDKGDNILHHASIGGHARMVQYIISQDMVDINSIGNYGMTPLMRAAYYGHRKVFDLFVSKGSLTHLVDGRGLNILHLAAWSGQIEMVKHILSHNIIDIISRTKTGRTPLMQAARGGHIDVFEFLVNMAANVSRVDDHGDNILHHASIGGHAKIVQHIISQDMVDINSRGYTGRTPLMRAAYYGHRKVFDLLVSKGGLTHLVDDQGLNVLHLTAWSGQVEMAKHILSQNIVDINSRTHTGKTPLIKAAYRGHKDVFKFLVSKGANVSHVDDKGDNILHLASLCGRGVMVKYILSQNMTDINARDKDGETAAMIARRKGYLDVYDLLVLQGCPAI